MSPDNSRIVDVLRATLVEVEQSEGVSPDDPAFVSLKSIVLRLIAEFEAGRIAKSGTARTRPAIKDHP